MGLEINFEEEDYPGISATCQPTSIVNVFTDNQKCEVVIMMEGKSIIIKL